MKILFYIVLFFSAFSSNYGRAQVRLDDTGSRVSKPLVDMRWRTLAPRREGADNAIEGQFDVDVWLHTEKFAGRRGKIYLTLMPTRFGDVHTRFEPQNPPFLSGVLKSGERVLFFRGTMPPRIQERVSFYLLANGNEVVSSEQLDFRFEFEPESL